MTAQAVFSVCGSCLRPLLYLAHVRTCTCTHMRRYMVTCDGVPVTVHLRQCS